MKLQQLQYVHEIVRHDLVMSEAAAALHTSQPGISKQIRLLEEELGVVIFKRNRSRLIALTDHGRRVLAIARRMLADANNLRRVAAEDIESTGTLTIATTHTQALHVLPGIIQRYMTQHPDVRLRLRQGTPAEIWPLLADGHVDIAISSGPATPLAKIAMFKSGELQRTVLTPPRHPLLKKRRITLRDLAQYPLISYDHQFSGRSQLHSTFEAHGLTPDFVLSATDTDVIKAYVSLGLGVAIVSDLAFDRTRDRALRAIDASHLFQSNTVYLGVRSGSHLPRYATRFIALVIPHLSESAVRAELQ
jgi:LysR family cys regulon transcriptional activator